MRAYAGTNLVDMSICNEASVFNNFVLLLGFCLVVCHVFTVNKKSFDEVDYG
jgi:hypothetical protein